VKQVASRDGFLLGIVFGPDDVVDALPRNAFDFQQTTRRYNPEYVILLKEL
jgi:hypothetical protein